MEFRQRPIRAVQKAFHLLHELFATRIAQLILRTLLLRLYQSPLLTLVAFSPLNKELWRILAQATVGNQELLHSMVALAKRILGRSAPIPINWVYVNSGNAYERVQNPELRAGSCEMDGLFRRHATKSVFRLVGLRWKQQESRSVRCELTVRSS